MPNPPNRSSGYARFLPEILRGGSFLDGYLKIFEALLSGRDDVPAGRAVPALERIIAGVPALLDPTLTPVTQAAAPASSTSAPAPALDSPFLEYLARWVALTFDQNWGLDKRREWLRRIVPLYKRRGTLAGLQAYLAMFVGRQARVEELPGGFVVGSRADATVGVSTFVAGGRAHVFRVRIDYGFPPDAFDIAEWKNVRRGTRAIVDLEKPAHTTYTLSASTPGIVVGGARFGGARAADPVARGRGRATIGKDTLIWQKSRRIGAAG